jgi:iron complex outermembrane receptor protein
MVKEITCKERLLSWCNWKFLNKHLKIELNNNTSIKTTTVIEVQLAISFDPSQAVRNADGTFFQWYTSPTEINQLAGKPVSLIDQFDNYGTSYRSIGNIQTEYKMHFYQN